MFIFVLGVTYFRLSCICSFDTNWIHVKSCFSYEFIICFESCALRLDSEHKFKVTSVLLTQNHSN